MQTRCSISPCNTAGLISDVSEEVATQIAKNCRRRQPHCHFTPPLRGIDRGSTGSGGSIDPSLFRVWGQSMLFDPPLLTTICFLTRANRQASLSRQLTTYLPKTSRWMENSTTFGPLVVSKIIKIVATRCQILRLKCTKFDFGWGSAPDPAGAAHSAPPDALAGFKGAYF